MPYPELSKEQRRQLIDAVEAFKTWHAADRRFRLSYRGWVGWRRRKGVEYLYRTERIAGVEVAKSLGRRSEDTEKLKADYVEARNRLRQRIKRSAARLKAMAPVNRALRLNRLPKIETDLLRAFDRAGLLSGHLFVAGTNALYAYEMMAGVLLATKDFDLLWDRRRLALVSDAAKVEGIIGVLRSVDSSFAPVENANYRARNDDGYLVDLIHPQDRDQRRPGPQKIGCAEDELHGVGIEGL